MKVQNPLIGRVKGSAGGMTGCKMYDKNVLKAKAFEVNNPKTPAQQTQRAFFKEVESYANLLSEEELKFLFPQKPKGMSRRSMLAKQLAEFTNTIDNEKHIDFDSLLTLGNAPTAKIPQVTMTWNGDSQCFVATLNSSDPYVITHAEDKVAILAINGSSNKMMLIYDEKPFENFSQELPSSFSTRKFDQVYGICFNVGNPVDGATFGTLGVVNRPARKKPTQN